MKEINKERGHFLGIAIGTILILLAYGGSGAAIPQWDIQPIVINGIENLRMSSMALDTKGNPHIFSNGYDTTNVAYYSKWNGTNWESLEMISDSPCVGWSSSIEIDKQDNPRIVFYNDCYGGPVYGINYAEKINNIWTITRIDTNFWTGKNNDLKLDLNDNPHIVYTSIDGYIKYARRIGGVWTNTNVENNGFRDSLDLLSMALDTSDKPHLAYLSFNTGYLRYARWDGSNWQFQNIEYIGSYNDVHPSIVIDRAGNPHIAYWNNPEQKIKYAKWNGTQWIIMAVDNADYDYNSMAINSRDEINVAYASSSILKLASLLPGETTWKTENITDGITTYPYINLDIGYDNLPQIVYGMYMQRIANYAKKHIDNSPIARFTFSPVTPSINEQVTLNASTSSDLDGNISNYTWDFGDSSTGSGEVVTHSYSGSGVYVINLTVTDDAGAKNSLSKTIVITSIAYKNLAINPNRTGFPNPNESDNGWGGGADKWDIVDGIETYPGWAEGLAFCGGKGNYCGLPPGWYQATVNFGENKTFNAVRMFHHAFEHVPSTYKIQYWNGSGWMDVYSTTNNTRCKDVNNTGDCIGDGWSLGITDTFTPVTSSKVRFTLNNYDITHGWIWEFEVFGEIAEQEQPRVSISTDKLQYSPGDTMTVNVSMNNPTNTQLRYEWYIIIPQKNKVVTYAKAPLPAGYNATQVVIIPISNWFSKPVSLVHFVHILDSNGKILAQDAASVIYDPAGVSAANSDIEKDLKSR